jgi:hypothetical protein
MNRLLIIFFLVYQASNSQSIVDLRFYDTCKDSVIRLDYSLVPTEFPTESNTDSFSDEFYFFTKDSILTVPPKKYEIYVSLKYNSLDYMDFSFTKTFLDKEKYNDTIDIPKVHKRLKNTGQYGHLFLGYYNCDKICNGHIIDYYSNGEIKLEGDFKNGIPIEITRYDINGKLITIEVYNKDGALIEIKNN